MNIKNGRVEQLSLFDSTNFETRRENPTFLASVRKRRSVNEDHFISRISLTPSRSVEKKSLLPKYLPNCFFLATIIQGYKTILSSSVAERSTVNRLVVGSNPTWGV